MSEIKTLIITSCTGDKKYKPQNQLQQADFRDPERLKKREDELEKYRAPAGLMYTGRQHLRLMEGINMLRASMGRGVLDLNIISAGYGLVTEEREIVPYEVTFSTMVAERVKEWSRFLKIKESLTEAIRGYDLIFFLLGEEYLRALGLPLGHSGGRMLFLASKASRKLIPGSHPYYFIHAGQSEAKAFGYPSIGLKGYLFKLLAQEALKRGNDIFKDILEDPGQLMHLLEPYRKEAAAEQPRLFPYVEPKVAVKKKEVEKREVNFHIPDCDVAKNFGIKMQFYVPECDDRVDPGFNFVKDKNSAGADPYSRDVYAHELYPSPNYDGILISKVNIDASRKKKSRTSQVGVRRFVRCPGSMPIMGDCGAFSYVDEPEPPYNTQDILGYYEECGFDYGVSIDHLIVGKYARDPDERKDRLKITKDNAADFLTDWRLGKLLKRYSFEPIGVAQGWDPASYRDSVANLVEMGYGYIALGGMAMAPTEQIFEVLKEVRPVIPDYLRVHLFGVARLEPLHAFRRLGVTSFDSATYLRKAWLGSGSNYFLGDGRYAAIRVPPAGGNKVRQMIKEGRASREQIEKLEQASLGMLRRYEKGLAGIDETLEAVLAYDILIGDGRGRHARLYRRVLEDRPWEKCGCKICRELGIEVIIFRGNNRNRRRGFHNTHVFYQKFREMFAGEGD